MSEFLTMNPTELKRLEIVQRLKAGSIDQQSAAAALGRSERQIRRLLRRYERRGAKGLISARRGRPAPNRLPPALREEAVRLVAERYADFGATYANEKLRLHHGLHLSTESLRKLLIAAGLCKPKRRRRLELHAPRERRERFGELVQIDGSHHDWFEGRGPKCCLLVFIDDATSALVALRFEEAETTWGYLTLAREYLLEFGKPFAFYSDRHRIFRITGPTASPDMLSQFGRALSEVRIELICANSPQAKGRVERANGTLQNRLIKKMRLHNVCTIEAANAFVPIFLAYYNERYARAPRHLQDAHRPLTPEDDLDRIFALKAERRISKHLIVHYEGRLYQIESKTPRRLQFASVDVREERDGTIRIEHVGRPLTFRKLPDAQPVAAIVDAKGLNSTVDAARKATAPHPQPLSHPWKQTFSTPTKRSPDADTLAWETPDITALG